MNRYVYSFIPIGVALVAGGIQTAIIGYSFGADQWYIAGLLIWQTKTRGKSSAPEDLNTRATLVKFPCPTGRPRASRMCGLPRLLSCNCK